MEKITTISPAWDKRDPNPEKNFGIHCCDLRMVLKGELGAVQFVLMTGWFTKEVRERSLGISNMYPLPADLGYHSPKPMYEGHTRIGEMKYEFLREDKVEGLPGVKETKVPEEDLPICEYLGCPCYYDGSGLNATKVFDILTEKGSDGVWEYLEKYYIDIFGELK